ncbi:hypothetical protein M5D96_007036, partial [Drosophila gunungcola]
MLCVCALGPRDRESAGMGVWKHFCFHFVGFVFRFGCRILWADSLQVSLGKKKKNLAVQRRRPQNAEV